MLLPGKVVFEYLWVRFEICLCGDCFNQVSLVSLFGRWNFGVVFLDILRFAHYRLYAVLQFVFLRRPCREEKDGSDKTFARKARSARF